MVPGRFRWVHETGHLSRGSKTSSPEKQKPSPRPERRVEWKGWNGCKGFLGIFWSWESKGYFPPSHDVRPYQKDYLNRHCPFWTGPISMGALGIIGIAGCWPFNFHDESTLKIGDVTLIDRYISVLNSSWTALERRPPPKAPFLKGEFSKPLTWICLK